MDQTTPPPYDPRVQAGLELSRVPSAAAMSERIQRIEDYRKRIRRALIDFMEKVPAAVRVGLDEFVPCLTWTVPAAVLPVPRKAARHPQNAARCSIPIKLALAEFHVADVVQVLHATVNYMTHPVIWGHAITGLGVRVRLLEGLARTGLDGSRVSGSESTGYHLIDASSPVVERDHAPIFGNTGISKEPEDKNDKGEQYQ